MGNDAAWSRPERAAELDRPSRSRADNWSVAGGFWRQGYTPGGFAELGRSTTECFADWSDKASSELAGEDGLAAVLTRREKE